MPSVLQRACATLTTIVLATGAAFGADTTAAFTASNLGWTASEIDPTAHITSFTTAPAPAIWDSVNGLPAGSLREPDLGNQWTCVSPPSTAHGNWANSLGGQIRFDTYVRFTSNLTWPVFALRGKNITLYCTQAPPPLNTWTSMSATLTGAGWRVNHWETGPVATNAQMLEVLADLRGIFLFLEWRNGTPDDSNADNFFMTGTPGPVCVGDVNRDGKTNTADFNIFATNFGDAVAPYTNGDLTGDGLVNTADFNLFAGDFGCGS